MIVNWCNYCCCSFVADVNRFAEVLTYKIMWKTKGLVKIERHNRSNAFLPFLYRFESFVFICQISVVWGSDTFNGIDSRSPWYWKASISMETVDTSWHQQSWLHWFQALQSTPKQRKDLRWWDDGTEWKQHCLRTFVGLKIVQAGLEDRVLRRLLGVWDKEGDIWNEILEKNMCGSREQ